MNKALSSPEYLVKDETSEYLMRRKNRGKNLVRGIESQSSFSPILESGIIFAADKRQHYVMSPLVRYSSVVMPSPGPGHCLLLLARLR